MCKISGMPLYYLQTSDVVGMIDVKTVSGILSNMKRFSRTTGSSMNLCINILISLNILQLQKEQLVKTETPFKPSIRMHKNAFI